MISKPRSKLERDKLIMRLNRLRYETEEIEKALSIIVNLEFVKIRITEESFHNYNDDLDPDETPLRSQDMTVSEFMKLLKDTDTRASDNPFTDVFFPNDDLNSRSLHELFTKKTENESNFIDVYECAEDFNGYHYAQIVLRGYCYSLRVRFITENKVITGVKFLIATYRFDASVTITRDAFDCDESARSFYKMVFEDVKNSLRKGSNADGLLLPKGVPEDDFNNDGDF